MRCMTIPTNLAGVHNASTHHESSQFFGIGVVFVRILMAQNMIGRSSQGGISSIPYQVIIRFRKAGPKRVLILCWIASSFKVLILKTCVYINAIRNHLTHVLRPPFSKSEIIRSNIISPTFRFIYSTILNFVGTSCRWLGKNNDFSCFKNRYLSFHYFSCTVVQPGSFPVRGTEIGYLPIMYSSESPLRIWRQRMLRIHF